jgi:hypothetical protein
MTEPANSKPVTSADADARPRRLSERWARPPRRSRRLTLALGALALATFAALWIWLANAPPPRITHGEAMRMALAIEEAKTVADLEPLIDLEGPHPPGSSPLANVAALIAFWKQRGQYTFVTVRTDYSERRSLLFRVHRHLELVDYHELRLDRRERAVKVTDLWSLLCGCQLSAAFRELEPEFQRPEVKAFAERLGSDAEAEALEQSWRLMTPAVRTSPLLGMHYLAVTALQKSPAVPAAIAEMQAAHPEVTGLDLFRLADGNAAKEVRVNALSRIASRIPDPDFLGQLYEKLVR